MHAFARRMLIVWLLLLSAAAAVRADETYEPGKTYFGRQRYIEYLAGDLPVILSAPHGGRQRPAEIPDREEGTFAFDTNTQELARAVADELHARTGHWPHLIVCRIQRRKLDCNREIVEAAAGNPLAEQAWHEFQGFIDAAAADVKRKQGRGIYIDLHGHGHPEQRLELGYLHSAEQLALDNAALNAPPYAYEGSLRAIAALGRLPYAALVRGPTSIGGLMEQQGIACAPSPSHPHPQAPFFRGGYNTARHGRDAGPLAGLQIETNWRGVRDTAASRAKFARALADTLEAFLPAQMGVSLRPVNAAAAAAEAAVPAPMSTTAVAPARCERGGRGARRPRLFGHWRGAVWCNSRRGR